MTVPRRAVVVMPAGPIPAQWAAASPFAGLDVCRAAGWEVLPGGPRPNFDEDFWDLTGLRDMPKSARSNTRRMDFRAIIDPAFRLTAKEYIFALAVPDHELVLALPDAARAAYKPTSCFNYCVQLVRWLNFLTAQGISDLTAVMQEHCDVYRVMRLERKRPTRGTGPISAGTMLTILQPVRNLAVYQELFSKAAYRPGFAPWPGLALTDVAGWKNKQENSVPAVAEEVFQPTVAAALYLTETLGPLVADEFERMLREVETRNSSTMRSISPAAGATFSQIVASYVRRGQPLPELDGRLLTKRIGGGADPEDPLVRVHVSRLINERMNYSAFPYRLVESVRPMLEDAVAKVGIAGSHARDATPVSRYDDQVLAPWSLPLTGQQLRDLAFVVLAACRILVASISGMRASELDELTPLSPQAPVTVSGDTQRFRLTSRLIKGHDLGGVQAEWVVLEPAYRAVQLAARLNQAADDGQVFPRSPTDFLHGRLRDWVNGPGGQRLGLAPIPAGPVNGRMLRRTLALTLAYRTGGLLAAKIHLKHVSVVTTEGYAHKPGGSQGSLLAEVERAQEEHHLELTEAAYHDYQNGRMPAGPGARDLIKAFEHIDDALKEHQPGPAAVLDSDRRLEMLLKQQAKSLHVQAANYCWFRDPSRALCLKLAGTPNATKPLAGMCDSARCPQATHHPCHLPVWESTAASNTIFLDNPRFPKAEKARLQPELERAQQIVNEIITANTGLGEE
ncbi:integrase [Streptomyces lavendulae]|uniref:integrase n=1 Tax=Streptomyces lavendulae TaxID=1914 RepID=UPI0024A20232|nr:integrase [Streptomyces lavendulae]GLV98559.1 integrase [Streptomyces lavendulae subsp. lavendulae]